jgi:predicted hexulose-6-phosphate isomerase
MPIKECDYRLGLYEKAMPPFLSWEEKLACTLDSGFDWLEISVDETDEKLARLDWGEEDIAALRRAMEKTGCPIHTLCLSGHRKYPLGARGEAARKRALAVMEGAVDLAARLGVRIIQLAGYDVYYEEGDAETRALFAENLGRSVAMAARRGMLLGFETMETPFMDTVEKAMAHVARVNSPYLGVYPDVGNLTNAARLYGTDVLADLRTGAGHILAAHLKETEPGRYRDMDFGTGHTDYAPAVALLYAQGVRMFTGEFWYLGQEDWRGMVRNAAAFLREKIGDGISAARAQGGA